MGRWMDVKAGLWVVSKTLTRAVFSGKVEKLWHSNQHGHKPDQNCNQNRHGSAHPGFQGPHDGIVSGKKEFFLI